MKQLEDLEEEEYSFISDQDWDTLVEALEETFNNSDLKLIREWLYGRIEETAKHD